MRRTKAQSAAKHVVFKIYCHDQPNTMQSVARTSETY